MRFARRRRVHTSIDKSCVLLRAVVGIALAISIGSARAADAESTDTKLQFNRDIRPILGGHCFKCHGPAEQEAGLRLDSAAAATALLPSESRAIVPGDPAASALLGRVTSDDADERMPPADAGPALSAAQIALLRQWIAEGAEYQKHWAYLPPVRPAAPAWVPDRAARASRAAAPPRSRALRWPSPDRRPSGGLFQAAWARGRCRGSGRTRSRARNPGRRPPRDRHRTRHSAPRVR